MGNTLTDHLTELWIRNQTSTCDLKTCNCTIHVESNNLLVNISVKSVGTNFNIEN